MSEDDVEEEPLTLNFACATMTCHLACTFSLLGKSFPSTTELFYTCDAYARVKVEKVESKV